MNPAAHPVFFGLLIAIGIFGLFAGLAAVSAALQGGKKEREDERRCLIRASTRIAPQRVTWGQTKWIEGPYHIKHAPSVSFDIVSESGDWVGSAYSIDEAQLFAASPDLYAALESAVKDCPCSLKERVSGHPLECYAPAAIAALKKARGEK